MLFVQVCVGRRKVPDKAAAQGNRRQHPVAGSKDRRSLEGDIISNSASVSSVVFSKSGPISAKIYTPMLNINI
jgi:hypothetical protein